MGQLGQTGIQMGAQGLMLKYSRGDESQADAVGAMILYKAGYNPQAMADFFKTLESQGGTPPQWLSDHPNPGNREQAIEKRSGIGRSRIMRAIAPPSRTSASIPSE